MTDAIGPALQQAIQFHQSGRLPEAENLYRQILAQQPNHAVALHLLGKVAWQVKKYDSAIELIGRAAQLRTDGASALVDLACVLRELGRFAEAEAAARRAVAAQPNFVEAYNTLGIALRDVGKIPEAIEVCRRAITMQPAFGPAYNTLGNALRESGRPEEAIPAFQQAVVLLPNVPQVHSNLGTALQEAGQLEESLEAFRRALTLDPGIAEIHSNLGSTLRELDRPEEAAAEHRRALELAPDSGILANNLANALKDMGELDEAVAAFNRAIKLHPGHVQIASNRLYTLHFHPDQDAKSLLREAIEWNERFAVGLHSGRHYANDHSPDRRLRIGYVSPDLRDHVVGRNLVPLFREHDRDRYEIFAYPTSTRSDPVEERLRSYCDHWKCVAGMNDEAAAMVIQSDQIDILVDLSLHMASNRLLIFARKPAPVQMTFAGYPGTTGLDAMDYRLTDPWLDPPGETDGNYVEKSIRLPHSFWCYDFEGMGLSETPPIGPLPALSNGFITFGCLNNLCKVNLQVLELWNQVLQAVPNSRLAVLAPKGSYRQRLADRWPGRVMFLDRRLRETYMQHYQTIDMGLDTVPYNGHTTSLDSYWMGVPVVTLVGNTVVGRAGWSQLNNLGLNQLAARTPDQFIEIAVGLAADIPRLNDLRAKLRDRMKSSLLMDGRSFARGVEAAYCHAWRNWAC